MSRGQKVLITPDAAAEGFIYIITLLIEGATAIEEARR